MDSTAVPHIGEGPASLSIRPDLLTQSQRDSLDNQGYLVLSSVVAIDDLERLRSAFDRACEVEDIPPGGTRHPQRLVDCEPAFFGVLANRALLAAVLHILGRPFRLGMAAGRDPLPGFGQQGLHMDHPDSVTALVLIDDFAEDNGATRLVPGSHLLRRPPSKSFATPASRHPDQVVVTAPAGSALVFNAYLWHAGTQNRSRGHRRVVQCSFG